MRNISFRKKRSLFYDLIIIFILYKAYDNIDTILIALRNIAVLSIFSVAIFFILKKIYLKLRYGNKQYSYFEMNRKIRDMSPREFEVFCANMFKELGYFVELTPASNDGGKDIILQNYDGETIYVECKHYSENNYVGREIFQKLVGAIEINGADKGILINTGKYNQNAIKCTESYDKVELWNMKDILRTLKKIDNKKVGIVLNYLKE